MRLVMTGIHPNRAFGLLLGAGLISASLLSVGFIHSLIASSPDGWKLANLGHLFLLINNDVIAHICCYAFIGMILVGTYTLSRMWYRQRARILSLATNIALLQIPNGELEQMVLDPDVKNKVRLIDSDTPICFCAGFISPRIYLSRGMVAKLTPDELEALLLHEKYHMENHDPLKILLGKTVVSALFFIPILRAIFKHYLAEKEVAADQSAIRYQGHSHGIAGALYKMLLEAPMVLNPPVAYGGDAIDHRIDYLTRADYSQKRPAIPKLHLAISSLVIAFITFTILAPLPTHLP